MFQTAIVFIGTMALGYVCGMTFRFLLDDATQLLLNKRELEFLVEHNKRLKLEVALANDDDKSDESDESDEDHE